MTTTNQTQDMVILFSKPFYQVICDFYQQDNEIYLGRDQIGSALGYSDPQVAIGKIHDRNPERLDKFSTFTELVKVEGNRKVKRNIIAYSLRGVMEICRFSRQPKADEFMDFVWDVMETLFRGEAVLTPTQSSHPLLEKAVYSLVQSQTTLTDCITQHGYQLQSIEDRLSRVESQNNPVLPSYSPLIQLLIEKRQDTSPHGCVTYREVYKHMMDKKSWKRQINRHKRKHGVLRASKPDVIANDTKILELFNKAVQEMLDRTED